MNPDTELQAELLLTCMYWRQWEPAQQALAAIEPGWHTPAFAAHARALQHLVEPPALRYGPDGRLHGDIPALAALFDELAAIDTPLTRHPARLLELTDRLAWWRALQPTFTRLHDLDELHTHRRAA